MQQVASRCPGPGELASIIGDTLYVLKTFGDLSWLYGVSYELEVAFSPPLDPGPGGYVTPGDAPYPLYDPPPPIPDPNPPPDPVPNPPCPWAPGPVPDDDGVVLDALLLLCVWLFWVSPGSTPRLYDAAIWLAFWIS